ncbi:MAG: galactose oxidase-like domain-containing protein [Pseudonocardiaceae bacterium]
MTPGLALLRGGMPRTGAKGAISLARSGDRAAESAWVRLGRWDPIFTLPNVAIHTHVLPNGKVLFWGRRGTPAGSMDEHECTPHVWDPGTGELTPTPQPQRADGRAVNLFCSGHAFLPDGRLLVAGGHATDGDGLDQACVYDFRANTWTALPVMNERRWYPTAAALPDGSVRVSSGSYRDNGRVIINEVAQIWDGHQWAPGARVTDLPPYSRGLRKCEDGRSVNYNTGKVIHIGGSDDEATGVPTAAADVIDLRANPPAWRATASMHFPRRQHKATILADGTVLVTGGTSGPGFNDLSPGKPVHAAELWNPATETWKKLAAEDVDRCYHATAVLLPDATVLSAGGGEFTTGNQPNDHQHSHRDAQIFHPPYLFHGPRPEITSAPGEVTYGETFPLEISGPEVGKITWIRLPSVTHSSATHDANQSQCINDLRFRRDHGMVTVTAPEQPEICPPGHYMLFVLSKAGVPSRARIMRISPAQRPAKLWRRQVRVFK